MRVALCQTNSGADVEDNVRAAEELLDRAAEGGADLAALPEVFAYLGSPSRVRKVAEPVPGPLTERLAERARRHGMWVLGGSIHESDGERVYNTSTLYDREGRLVARYRKIHLFDADLPGQPPFRESAAYSAGEQIVTTETEFGRAGLAICYDLRFPELFRALVARGCDLVLLPSQFQHDTGKDHWEVLVRARAIENQCFVIAPGQWGPYGPPEKNRRSHGNSMVVDPWGRVLARAPDGVGVTFADLDPDEVRRVRERLPALGHRRLGLQC